MSNSNTTIENIENKVDIVIGPKINSQANSEMSLNQDKRN